MASPVVTCSATYDSEVSGEADAVAAFEVSNSIDFIALGISRANQTSHTGSRTNRNMRDVPKAILLKVRQSARRKISAAKSTIQNAATTNPNEAHLTLKRRLVLDWVKTDTNKSVAMQ
jgi:hypothetical protein